MPVLQSTSLKTDAILFECLSAFQTVPFSKEGKEILKLVKQGKRTLSKKEKVDASLFVKVQGLLLLSFSLYQGAGRSPFRISSWKSVDHPFSLLFDDGQTITLSPLSWQPGFDALVLAYRKKALLASPEKGEPIVDQGLLRSAWGFLSQSSLRLSQEETFLSQMAASPLDVFHQLGKKFPIGFLFIFLSSLPLEDLRWAIEDFASHLPDGIAIKRGGEDVNLKQWMLRPTFSDQELFDRVHVLLRLYEGEESSFIKTLILDSFLNSIRELLEKKEILENVQRIFQNTVRDQYETRIGWIRSYLNLV